MQRWLIACIFLVNLVQAQSIAPFLSPPFTGAYPVSNVFDHAYPFAFEDTGGTQLSFWGAEVVMGYDGHTGYDWVMPEGTRVLAAAEGEVVFAGASTSFCPFPSINREVEGVSVTLKHEQVGVTFFTTYAHLSEVFVKEGQQVNSGFALGRSGNTGCSRGPHLHFGVRALKEDGSKVFTDPYGWHGSLPDPWERHEEGAKSWDLWLEPPDIYRESELADDYKGNPEVLITRVHYMGINDAKYPNNEFIELSVNRKEAPNGYFLGKHRLMGDSGESYIIPNGFYLYPGKPVRIFSGHGIDNERELYWGLDQPVWNDNGGCVALKKPNGQTMFRFRYRGEGNCPD
ncbi:MAG: peptidoglycan DD-metalloendopeptidase family protein [Trueperaceae bacterium]|nr:peptidoglycan DD-metalloendopeptidase family protein [Trueperaceae bacterium]